MIIKKYLFIALLLVLSVTFFTRNNLRSVDEIAPKVLSPPSQSEIYGSQDIEFVSNNYEYRLSPLFNYEISALLVSKINYGMFIIDRSTSIFPIDLCLIWGSNVKNKLYKDSRLRFSQDCRWCWVQWEGNVGFNFEDFSNNHLLINNKGLERKIKSLVIGDQLKIKGKLVNVKAKILGKAGEFDSKLMEWKTSVSRTDQGGGSCEVIYVEDIEVLKRANVPSRYLFQISLFGLLALIFWRVLRFFI